MEECRPSAKDVHVGICRTCDFVTFHSKTDFVDVSNDLEMGRLSWIFWRGATTSILIRGRQEYESQKRSCDDRSRHPSDAIAGKRP